MGKAWYSEVGGIPCARIDAHPNNYSGSIAAKNLLVIHDIEGPASAAISEFKRSDKEASTQFVADPVNDRFVQMVSCFDNAWGAGNGKVNARSIQIELPGYYGRPFDPEVIHYAGVWLGAMAREFGIPLVKLTLADVIAGKSGVIGHSESPNENDPTRGGGKDGHMDPGPTFPWDAVLAAARAGVTGPTVGEGGGETGEPVAGFRSPTGFAIARPFGGAYIAFGGLAAIGHPISRLIHDNKRGLAVQVYERARLELHPSGLVTRGLVGTELVDALGWRKLYPDVFTPDYPPAKERRLSHAALVALAQQKGFSAKTAQIVAAIALAESGGDPDARSPVNDREDSRGILQINLRAHPSVTEACAHDPACAMSFAFMLSRQGTNFTPWSVYKDGKYKKFLGGGA